MPQSSLAAPPNAAPKISQLGLSPDLLEDYIKKFGSPEKLMEEILKARHGEKGADSRLLKLSSTDRSALDRFANFALMRKQPGGPLAQGAKYLGGMGAMAVTEAMKASPALMQGASTAWRKMTGGSEEDQPFFGGSDVSKPSLSNLTSAHYGFWR